MSNCPKCGLIIQHGAYASTVPACRCALSGGVVHMSEASKPIIDGLVQRIAALEAANSKQAARIAELEDEREKLEKQEQAAHEWWALVMCAAAELEDASIGMTDKDAKSAAEGAAKHYRARANELFAAAPEAV